MRSRPACYPPWLLVLVLAALTIGCGPKTEQAVETPSAATVAETPVGPSGHTNTDALREPVTELEVDDADPAADASTALPPEPASAASDAAEGNPSAATEAQTRDESSRRSHSGGNRGIDEVRATGIEERALNVGAAAVDGRLLDAEGDAVQLSDLWREQPLVLVWYRGGWCPFCNRHLAAIQKALPEIREAGALVAAITPELPDRAAATMADNELDYIVLSDRGNKLAHKYGVAFKLPDFVATRYQQGFDLHGYNGDNSDELPLAATYVIDTDGMIRYAFIDADYTRRADPKDIIAALEEL